MRTADRDMNSYVAIVDSFINHAALEPAKARLIKEELKKYITVRFQKKKWVHPEITKFCTDWYREFYRLVEGKDPYVELKQKSNEKALNVLPIIRVESWQDALALGIIGNRIDYGACLYGTYNLEQLRSDVSCLRELTIHINDTTLLIEKLEHAKKVLFLVDNNGEIIFDTFLLERISSLVGKENVWIMGKESPMLNDATVEDLRSHNFEKYGKIVSTGSNCFGLHVEDVSKECVDILRKADVIIAKGQAYLEFFTEYNFENVFNVLTVKYPIKSAALGILPPGHNVVLSSARYSAQNKNYFKEYETHVETG